MSKSSSLKRGKEPIDALENLKRISEEVRKWPKWKRENTLLAFSEYQRKKAAKISAKKGRRL